MASSGSTSDRGYGWQHQQLRAWWKPKVNAGHVRCARCKRLIKPDPSQFGDGWQLDHDPTDQTRRKYLGPSHTRCNQGGAHPDEGVEPEAKPRTEW